MLILRIPSGTQAFNRSMHVLPQVIFVDRVFDVLQDFRLFSQLFGPVGVEIEAE